MIMTTLGSEELQTITELASKLIPLQEIAITLEIDIVLLRNAIRDNDNDIAKAFYEGLMQFRYDKAEIQDNTTIDVELNEYTIRRYRQYKAKLIIELY